MSSYGELEKRLSTALSRIEAATQDLPDASEASAREAETKELRAQLDEERTTNAQLIERVKALKDRQETQVTQLEENLANAQAADGEKAAVQGELKARVEELRDQIARLTEANRAMVGDADLVNTSMMVELDAMRASRRADVTEIDDIIGQLQPHLQGGANA